MDKQGVVISKPMNIINYELIDTDLREVIGWLNQNKHKTVWCCSGHNPQYVFDDYDKKRLSLMFGSYSDLYSYNSYVSFKKSKRQYALKFYLKLKEINFPLTKMCVEFGDFETVRIYFLENKSDIEINKFWKGVYSQLKNE